MIFTIFKKDMVATELNHAIEMFNGGAAGQHNISIQYLQKRSVRSRVKKLVELVGADSMSIELVESDVNYIVLYPQNKNGCVYRINLYPYTIKHEISILRIV